MGRYQDHGPYAHGRAIWRRIILASSLYRNRPRPVSRISGRFARLLLFTLALSCLPPANLAAQAPPTEFAHAAFSTLWERTDSLVASGAAKRAWLWGPRPNSAALYEEYLEGSGARRLVQYFDKSRMEVNDPAADPNSPFYVTNGLLTVELISGQMQVGNTTFVKRQPSRTNVTGDQGDTLAPSYADLGSVSSARGERQDPDRTGQAATATLSKAGVPGSDPSKASVPGVKLAYYERTTGHNVPQAMWDFLNSTGPISVRGKPQQGRLIEPWFYASGLPISDPYWVRATIAGKPTDVLVQAYERRVLTYVPTNPEGFKVEMGNVGQHYYLWRYGEEPAPATLSRFAVELNADLSPQTLDGVKAAGAGAARLYLGWAGLEPDNVAPAQYDWAKYDGQFKALADRGLQPIVLVTYCPAWACSRTDGPIRGERVGDFAEFMGAVAARYGKPPYNAHHWELWNEPDSTTSAGGINYHWGTYGARYAAMLAAVRPAMKAADPSAQLVLGGLAYDGFQEDGGPFVRRFLDDVLDAGGGRYLDAVNFHYYVQNIHWCSFKEKLDEVRAKLMARKLDLPIISTETGITSDPAFDSSDTMQSMYVAQVYAQSLGEGMLSTTWFLARDYDKDIVGQDLFEKSGLLDIGGAPKPAHGAYRVVVDRIGERPVARALAASDGLAGRMRGYEFGPAAAQGGPLWVIWDWDVNGNPSCPSAPAPRDFSIPASRAASVKAVLDVHGKPVQTRTGTGGSLVFSLDASPVYIEWTR